VPIPKIQSITSSYEALNLDKIRVEVLQPWVSPNFALGGISTGQDILASIAMKPTSSILLPGRSINKKGEPVEVVTKGRHDPCVGIRATPIAEAMLALVLMDHLLRHRAQNQGVQSATPVIPAEVKS